MRIAEVVALIDDNESVVAHIVGIDAFGVRHNGSFEVITYDIFLPHVLQICRADDQCRAAEVVLKNFGNSTCCDSLSQSYHIANHRALVLLVHQMLCRNLHGVFLEWEEHFLELWSKLIAVNASTCILAEPVGSLEVYIIRLDDIITSPTVVDGIYQVIGNVNTQSLVPAIIKPTDKDVGIDSLLKGRIQLALSVEAGKGKVAATHDGFSRMATVLRTMSYIEFGVKLSVEIESDRHLLVLHLL